LKMDQENLNRDYKGTMIFGIVIIGVVAARGITYYWGLSNFLIFVTLLIIFCMIYFLSLSFPDRIFRYRFLYFSLQTILILILSNLQPALDITNLLFITLSLQVVQVFSIRAATSWLVLYAILLIIVMIMEQGWMEGLILSLFFLAGGIFVVSYDLLYLQARGNQIESQRLLMELQISHQKLKEYAAQAEELATTRERNRLARELHDSVSQLIFSIMLTASSAQKLLEKDPARLPEQFDRLEEMTSNALGQLRSLIAQLHPPH
jgi:signal transduction histidine kinase